MSTHIVEYIKEALVKLNSVKAPNEGYIYDPETNKVLKYKKVGDKVTYHDLDKKP